jgi:ketosteroid isomerase-like protein
MAYCRERCAYASVKRRYLRAGGPSLNRQILRGQNQLVASLAVSKVVPSFLVAMEWTMSRISTDIVAAVIASTALAAPLAAHEPPKTVAVGTALPPSAKLPASVVDAFHAALRRGDARTAAALLADDALIYESGGAERSRAEYTSHHLAADVVFEQAVPSVLVRRTGRVVGEFAWIASEGRTTGIYHEKPVDRLTTETMVLRKSGAAWEIVHIHWSSAAVRP